MAETLDQVERAVAFIARRGSARSDAVGKLLDIGRVEAEQLLAPAVEAGRLTACDINRPGDDDLIEYRVSSLAGTHQQQGTHQQTWRNYPTAPRREAAAHGRVESFADAVDATLREAEAEERALTPARAATGVAHPTPVPARTSPPPARSSKANPPKENTRMTTQRATPQTTVLEAIGAGVVTQAHLVEMLDGTLDAKQISNALYNLQKAGKITAHETDEGRKYRVGKGAAAAKKPAARKAMKAPAKAAKRPAKRVVPLADPTAPPASAKPAFAPEGFRCGLFSDGGLAIEANEAEMRLTADQTRALVGFLEHTTILRAAA